MERPALTMAGIRKSFPGVVALDGVDLTLQAGEVHVLLGENGAGKSTLMKILAGAYRRDAGEILMQGRPVDIAGPRDARALGIRVIHQELSLVPSLSVAENIFLGAAPSRFGVIDWASLRARAIRLLSDLGVAIDPDAPVNRLALPQRQMVEIAKALADQQSASVLVMDEPTSALTSREVDVLFGLIERLAKRGVAIVYITHRLDEVYRIGHRVTVLRDGRNVSTAMLGDTSVSGLVSMMANRDLADHYPKQPAPIGNELLRAEGLGRAGVLEDISFSIRAGEIVGMAGLMGAGRTDVARAITGADRVDRGRLFVRGRAVSFRAPADAIREGIGLLPEDRKAHGLVALLNVARNIALPQSRKVAGPAGIVPRRAEAALAAPVIRDLRIKATPDQQTRQLSGGNQQKVVLGKWVAGDARIFVFDEPTRGVDIGAKVEIYQLMNRLTAAGAGILMISSELPELLGMSDRILVMHRGRIQAEFTAAAATQERVLSAALGLAGPVLSESPARTARANRVEG
ncbi:MAG: sugar ABC transporter ATP-binding protein [Acidimicrobiia bacterium]|nr:sugar ABC transporter ATP-binding protein [Acidimicrobiia bacterium]